MLKEILTLPCCHQSLYKDALTKAKVWSAGNPSPNPEGFALGFPVPGLQYKFLIGELVPHEQKANSKCLFHKVLKAPERWIHIKDNEPWYICYKAKQLI